MVLAIATPALAGDPEWAGAPGSMYLSWTYDEEPPGDFGEEGGMLDAPDEQEVTPHPTREDPEDLQQEYLDGFVGEYPGLDFTGIYGWHGFVEPFDFTVTPSWTQTFAERYGVLTGVGYFGFYIKNFEFITGTGHKDFSVQITWYLQDGTLPAPLWFYIDDSEGVAGFTEESVEEIDLGGDWTRSTFYMSTQDPCTMWGDDVNPSYEFIEIGADDPCDLGRTWVLAIDEVTIHTICYEGDEPPLGPGGDGTIVVEPNIISIYEPFDAGGPPVQGPVVGNFGVKLGWMPEEPYTVYVTVDPNTEGDGPNEDYIIQGADPDATVTLAFNQSNWDDLQKVHIEARKDVDREGTEIHLLELTSSTDETNGDPNFRDGWFRMILTVVDNDTRYLSVLPDEIELSENQAPPDPCGTKCFDVRLSHQPEAKVGVWVNAEGDAFSEDEKLTMFIIDPNFEQYPPLYADPNRMTFTVSGNPEWNQTTMTSNWDVVQTICVRAKDNNRLFQVNKRYVEGSVVLKPFSEDPGYRVPDLNADGSEAPGDPPDSGGEAVPVTVAVKVEDNECGALGYDHTDIAGDFDTEGNPKPDCLVGLADIAVIYSSWASCTKPYDGGISGWTDCDALWNLQ